MTDTGIYEPAGNLIAPNPVPEFGRLVSPTTVYSDASQTLYDLESGRVLWRSGELPDSDLVAVAGEYFVYAAGPQLLAVRMFPGASASGEPCPDLPLSSASAAFLEPGDALVD